MSEIQYKRCSKCKQEFPATTEYFGWYKKPNKLRYQCKNCQRESDRIRRKEHPENYKEAQKKFRLKHPERSKEIKKNWQDKNKEYTSQFHAKRYLENRDDIRQKQSEYDKKNPEKKRARSQKRRAMNKNAEGKHTAEDIKQIYYEQEGRCSYCGIPIYWDIDRDIHVEHMTPLSRGGSNWPENMACACGACNLSKGNKTVEEWITVRGW